MKTLLIRLIAVNKYVNVINKDIIELKNHLQ
jgi:hypothetical protein